MTHFIQRLWDLIVLLTKNILDDALFFIILPTFNQADFLKLSIRSILNQTYKNWELLIINNNSKDKTYEVIKVLRIKELEFLKLIIWLLAKSRNLGINKARSMICL